MLYSHYEIEVMPTLLVIDDDTTLAQAYMTMFVSPKAMKSFMLMTAKKVFRPSRIMSWTLFCSMF